MGRTRARAIMRTLAVLGTLLGVLTWFAPAGANQINTPWRIRIKEAAVVVGERVLLGEIAEVVGEMDTAQWRALSARELWQSPPIGARPMAVNRDKLAAALNHYLGKGASMCLLPMRLAIRRGGRVLLERDLREIAQKELTPRLAPLDGEGALRDYRLPPYLFLEDEADRVVLKTLETLEPGSLGLRFAVVGADGRVRDTVSAGVFLDLWKAVPAAGKPLNRADALTPENITTVRKNMAYLRDGVWDGLGGPWRVKRPVGTGQVLYASNLEPIPSVSRGDRVRMVFKGANLRLEAMGEALADGSPGDDIPVRNLQSRRQVYARVVDSGTVRVR